MLWTCLKPVQFSVNEMSLGVDCAASVYMHAKVYVMSAYQTVLLRSQQWVEASGTECILKMVGTKKKTSLSLRESRATIAL